MRTGQQTRVRRAVYVLVGLVALLCAAYAYLTNTTRLRAKALAVLESLDVERVVVGEVTFSLWNGLQLHDVVIDTRDSEPAWHGAEEVPPSLRIGLVRMRCDLVALLFGRVHPTAVELHDVAAALIYDPLSDQDASAADDRDAEARFLREWLQTATGRLPSLLVTQADVQLLVVERGRPQLIRRQLLQAEGQATCEGYELRVERRPAAPTPLAQVRWRKTAGDVELAWDWADLRTIRRLAPPQLAEVLQQLALSGRARLDRAVLRMGRAPDGQPPPGRPVEPGLQIAAAELSLANLGFIVPIEEDAVRSPSSADERQRLDHFLQLSDGSATVSYRQAEAPAPAELSLQVSGRLRGAPTTLSVTLRTDPVPWLQSLDREPVSEGVPESALSLDDVLQAELSVEELQLPTAATYPAFVRCRHLGGPIAAFFKDYQPHGRVNVRLHVLPPGTVDADGKPLAGAGRLDGEIEARGAGCRYMHFPYDFEDAWGHVRLTHGRIVLDGLCARHGEARVCADGVINDSKHWAGFDLTFRGQDVALEGDLYAALPEDHQRLWQYAAPQGHCEVVANVRRAEGSAGTGPLPHEIDVSAHLSGGSVALGDGERLRHADGWLTVRGNTVSIRALRGYMGDASVRLDGSVRQIADSVQHDLRVEIGGLPVEQTTSWSPSSAGPGWKVRFAGHADACGHVWGTDLDSASNRQFAVRLSDGNLWGLDPNRPWTATRGLALVTGAQRELIALDCRQGDAQLDATGMLPTGNPSDRPLTLQLHASTPVIEQLYPQFVPADWTRVIEMFGLTGAAEVAVRMYPRAVSPAATEQAAELELRADRMTPRPMPLGLREVDADLTLGPGRFRVNNATARCGDRGTLSVTQAHDGTWHSGLVTADFAVAARGLKFGSELNAAMPELARGVLERLAVRGPFELVLSHVSVSGAPQSWQLAGNLSLQEAALHVGLDLTELTGKLSGTCAVGPDGLANLDAKFAIERAQLAGRPLESGVGQLVHLAGERWVRIENLQARLCDGVARGALRIDPRTSDYELSVQLYDVSAAQLFPAAKSPPERPRRGRLDAEVWLRGREGENSSRQGGGELRLTGASFIQTPVLAAVFQTRAQSALADTVDQARVRFRWDGGDILLERIDIRSKDLQLVGEGTWKLDTDALHLTLWGARPESWPRLSVISDWLETAGQELVQYRVEGTWADPKVSAEPLHKLNAALRRLLGEGSE